MKAVAVESKLSLFDGFVNIKMETLRDLFGQVSVADAAWSEKCTFNSKRRQPVAAVEDFFKNKDHGFPHSVLVRERCCQLWSSCHNIRQCFLETQSEQWHKANNSDQLVNALFSIEALCHDYGRFCGCHFSGHEHFGAVLATLVCGMMGLYQEGGQVWAALEFHDYMGRIASGEHSSLFTIASFPLAELFRLADKTSVTPAEEVERYWQTARRYKMPLFDPTITDEVRFDLARNANQRTDSLTWMLLLFAQQPSDFLFRETAAAFDRWRDKKALLDKMMEIAAIEGYSEDVIFAAIRRFHNHHGLSMR
jgi:hypothetical protein